MKMWLLILSGIGLVIAMLVAPDYASAQNQPITVQAPRSERPVSENDVLKYLATQYPQGYVNITWDMPQATIADRMNGLRQMTTQGFDPNSADAFLYSALLPNSATLASATTWFGHPIEMAGGQYIIRGWFSDGRDAIVEIRIVDDIRINPEKWLPYGGPF